MNATNLERLAVITRDAKDDTVFTVFEIGARPAPGKNEIFHSLPGCSRVRASWLSKLMKG